MSAEGFTWKRDDPLARCKKELRKANDALRDYWFMGPGRSLEKLCRKYIQSILDGAIEPPTRHIYTLERWSVRYQWQVRVDRAKEIADDEIAELERQARREAILGSGYALYYERIAGLQRLADLLEKEVYEDDKRWLPDVKQIGAGDQAEKVEIVRFNSALIQQFRSALEDIAAEMGERVKRQEISGPDGGPIETTIREIVVEMSDDQPPDESDEPMED